MANITAAASGNWSSSSTWSGGVVPGAGDTAIINGSHQVTVDVNTTVGKAGANYSADTTSYSIYFGGTGSLVIAAGKTLTARGDLVFAQTSGSIFWGITMQAGSTLQFDSTQTSPTTTNYAFAPQSNSMYGCSLKALGTQSQPCLVTSVAGGGNGIFYNGNPWAYFGSLSLQWTTFKNIGTSANDCWVVSFNGNNVTASVSNCVFDTCGQMHALTTNTTATNSWNNVMFQNSQNSNWCVRGNGYNATYTNCVFDKQVDSGNAVFQTCYFANGWTSNSGNSKWTFTDNICVKTDPNECNTDGDVQSCYLIHDHDTTNPHFVTVNANWPPVYTNNIFEYTGNSGNGDGIIHAANPTAANANTTVTGNIVLPNAGGECTSNLVNGGEAANQRVWDARNNTIFSGSEGLCSTADVVAFTSFPKLQNNIIWDYAGKSRGYVIQDVTGLGAQSTSGLFENFVTPANASNNCTINLEWTYPSTPGFVNQGNGYQGWFSATPGQGDIHVDPQFKDNTKTFATFDSRYLGVTASATWASQASTHTFQVGDVISHTDSGYYGGAVINFRCIQAHVKSTSGSEPGTSTFNTSWRSYWEFNTLYVLRQAVYNGTTYTDASLGLSAASPRQALYAWVRDGYAPTNTALKGASSDGTDIGAVPVYVAGGGGGGGGGVGNNQNLSLLGIG